MSTINDATRILTEFRRVLTVERESLSSAVSRSADEVVEAIQILQNLKGDQRVIIMAVGKSGHIAAKLAATFASTGTPAFFVNASEAMHGDLGMIQPGEPVIMISKSGTTAELLAVVRMLKTRQAHIIALVGNIRSPLAFHADVAIDASVVCEADYLDLAPTASSTLALALGDALACTLMWTRGFATEDFALLHPGGQLGAQLNLRVEEVMRIDDEIPIVSINTEVLEVLKEISKKKIGGTCITEQGILLGIITDGDLRRALETHRSLDMTARDMLNTSPLTVGPDTLIDEALRIAAPHGVAIQMLPVIGQAKQLVGAVWYYDMLQATTTAQMSR